MEKDELIQLFDSYLNETRQWFAFSEWLSEKEGLTMTDVGFEE
ncbi:hypothetical protein [Zunongwangia sp. SCSIO 43204]|nr:hypothetical protein [Zunongwangia sp. SCSIO 43204]